MVEIRAPSRTVGAQDWTSGDAHVTTKSEPKTRVADPRAIVYGRVSMVKQKESGAGEMAQEDDCTAFVERLGYELVGPFLEDEAVSGSKSIDQRPALLEAIGNLRKGDFLVVAK